ncbi:hypothetical protein GCM10009676_02580 [Prauserella halophila]|uniref:LigA protein n=1 Tax=Prauserella halophila TaxID=185641 RepID=A0ABN1VW22_9PSEU|nr:DUF2087 domain-containing protein [Prauserella halophila]MCP2234402.1 hypothetical protein (DUF2087) [Prauserella halophila]
MARGRRENTARATATGTGAADEQRTVTTVRHGAGYHLLLWGLFPLLGAAGGWLLSNVPGWLPALPDWVSALPFLPGPEKIEAVAGLSGPVLTIVLAVLGAGGGVLLAASAYDEVITVEVDDAAVRVAASGATTEVARDRFGVAFLDGKELVILDVDTAEVVRVVTDHDARRLRDAFAAHTYPWSEGDPHEGTYRRWLDGTAELDDHVQALLRTRREALASKDTGDAAALRRELAEHGVVVRDEEGRQYWRALTGRGD